MSPGEQLIDIVHIDDVVEAYMLAAQQLLNDGAVKNEVYSVSSQQPIPLKELASIIEKIMDIPLQVNWGGRPYHPREIMIPWNKGVTVPKWKPKITLVEGIKRLICLNGNLYLKISITLPVLNKEATIVPLIAELHRAVSEYKNAELRIIFDGCYDQIEYVVKQFFQTVQVDYSIAYETTPNIFEIKTNNIGLKKSSSDLAHYDTGMSRMFQEVMERNTNIFYARWTPSTNKDFAWIHLTRVDGSQVRRKWS
ncbi:NAD-dependent epimerase/dehydratase family protein [Paenibacillus sp. TAF43_2]